MKRTVALLLVVLAASLLASAGSAGDREHPTTSAIARESDAVDYGMPLSEEEQHACSSALNSLASMLGPPRDAAHIASSTYSRAKQGTATADVPEELPGDFSSLISIFFARADENDDGNVYVYEDFLAQIVTDGTSENRAYPKLIDIMKSCVNKLSAVKDIWSKYPGMRDSSQRDLLEFADKNINWCQAHVDFFEGFSQYTPEFLETFGTARIKIATSHEMNPAKYAPEYCKGLSADLKKYAGQCWAHKAVPTDAGSGTRRRPIRIEP